MMDQFPKDVSKTGRVRICLELLRQQKIKNKTIVDIGSSFGWLEKEIEDEGAKKIIGIEQNRQAVEFAKSQVKSAKFYAGDALDTKLSKNYADIVTVFDVIEHIPKGTENRMLNEMNRILKPNGILLLSTPYNNILSNFLDPAWYIGHRHYSEEKIRHLLKKTNFKVLNITPRGDIFSSLYLFWFYLMKTLTGNNNPRNEWIEKFDDKGYNKKGITDIFLVAQKIK